jgi:peptidyl-dipeptidase A
MKFASVALSALAVSLATPALADHHAEAPEAAAAAYPMTPQGAADWVAMVEQDMFDFSVEYGRVLWLNNTYIVHDSNQLAAKYGAQATEKSVTYANEAAQYAQVAGLDPEVARKLDILRNGIVMPAPVRDGAATELNEIATKLGAAYGQGTGTLNGEEINGSDIEAEMGNLERTPEELAEMWTSWHDNVGAPMRGDYQRMIAIANEGSKELGFADLGAMWRSNYDMDPDQFAAETERMWQEVKPLYMALHTYVRSKLNEKYGDDVQPATGAIRADLLGNMWAQEWGNIYPLVAPEGAGDIG